MKAVILYAPAGIVTGRRLRQALGIHGGYKWLPRLFDAPDILIRWGSRVSAPKPRLLEINDAATLAACATRWQMLKGLENCDAVRTPVTSRSPIPDRPCLGRSNHGMQGRDITFYEEGLHAPPHGHDFYMEYLSKEREWRAHIIDGKLVKVLEKTGGATDEVVWNYHNGFTFTYPGKEAVPKGIRPMAKAAVDALGLDIGAVDLITHKGLHYVLEVNTAPGLSDLSLDSYVLHLKEMMNRCYSAAEQGSD